MSRALGSRAPRIENVLKPTLIESHAVRTLSTAVATTTAAEERDELANENRTSTAIQTEGNNQNGSKIDEESDVDVDVDFFPFQKDRTRSDKTYKKVLERLQKEKEKLLQRNAKDIERESKEREQANRAKLDTEKCRRKEASSAFERDFLIEKATLDLKQDELEIGRLIEEVENAENVENAAELARFQQKLIRTQRRLSQRIDRYTKAQRFFEKHIDFLNGIKVELGIATLKELTVETVDRTLDFSPPLATATQKAVRLISRYVADNELNLDALSKDNYFHRLVTIYYSRGTGKVDALQRTDIDRQVYQILRWSLNMNKDEIARRLLGTLNFCR